MWVKKEEQPVIDTTILNNLSDNSGKLAYKGQLVDANTGGGGDVSLPITSPVSISNVDVYFDATTAAGQGWLYAIVGMYDLRNQGLTAGTMELAFTPVFSTSPTQVTSITQANLYSSTKANLFPVSAGASSSATVSAPTITSGTRITLTANITDAQIANGFAYWSFKMNNASGDSGTQYKVTFQNMVLKLNNVEIPKNKLIGATPHTVYTPTISDIKINRTYNQVNTVLQSRWAGKTVCFYGDSITASTHGGVGPRYPDIVPRILGTSYAEDRAASGMAIVNPSNTLQSRMYMHQNFDLITIALGFNDWSFGVPMGTLGAWGEATTAHDKTTFYGGYRWCLDQIQGKNPYATVVLMIPIWTGNNYDANSQGLYIDDYRNAIRNIAKLYNLPVYESNLNINMWNKDIFVHDGSIHIGDLGHWRYADHFGSYLASL